MKLLLLLATFGIFVFQSCYKKESTAEVVSAQAIAQQVDDEVEKPVRPPLPDSNLTSSEELKYIFETDQQDRISGLFLIDIERDALRLKRVTELYDQDEILTIEDKFHAAFIFTHAGGPLADVDPENYLIAFLLFNEVSKQSMDPAMAQEAAVFAKNAGMKYFYATHRSVTENGQVSDLSGHFIKYPGMF